MKKFPHLPACRCGHHNRVLSKSDDWYINAPCYNNCFWNYIRHNNRPHGLKEIAELLNLSISAITTIERKGLDKLKKKLKKHNMELAEFLPKN